MRQLYFYPNTILYSKKNEIFEIKLNKICKDDT